jgi:hypothetical protein
MKITPNVPTNAFTLKAQATWNVLFDDNNKAVAIFSTKSRLADVAIMAPEMYELLTRVATSTNSGYGSMMSAATLADTLRDLSSQAKQLLAKIEGGGDE